MKLIKKIVALMMALRKTKDTGSILKSFVKTIKALEVHIQKQNKGWLDAQETIDKMGQRQREINAEVLKASEVLSNLKQLIKE